MTIAKISCIFLAGALALSAASHAETAPAANTSTSKPAETKPAETTAVTTGSVSVEQSVEQRMKDCMAIWDKGTHMTRDQWRRTCKTTLQEFSN